MLSQQIYDTFQDIEQHVNDKWKKKLTRMQADMTKVKSQMDELNIKNTSLREKLASASNYRDKVGWNVISPARVFCWCVAKQNFLCVDDRSQIDLRISETCKRKTTSRS